ncbi:MAG: DNA-processing protein DprA [Caldimicrobium sp.]
MEEKLIALGLYLKEKGSFKYLKLIENEKILEDYLTKNKLKVQTLMKLAEDEIERANRLNIKVLFIKEKDFPEELKAIPYPPPFLYIKGSLCNLPKISLIGSRKPTSYGKEVASHFTKELALAGVCPVSGLARGIDTIVHKSCVNLNKPTLAILGSGLDIIYPPENKKLSEEIVDKGGAVISEFPLGSKPKKENFPRRNRLISGISLGLIIIEAGEKSGTLITAKWAQEQGKDVFAIPGNIFSEQSKGTHLLLKEGAIPVTHPREVLEYLELNIPSTPLLESKKQELPLSPDERKILEVLSSYPISLEELAQKTELPISKLLTILTELEVKNLILSLPGKFYQLNPLFQ